MLITLDCVARFVVTFVSALLQTLQTARVTFDPSIVPASPTTSLTLPTHSFFFGNFIYSFLCSRTQLLEREERARSGVTESIDSSLPHPPDDVLRDKKHAIDFRDGGQVGGDNKGDEVG